MAYALALALVAVSALPGVAVAATPTATLGLSKQAFQANSNDPLTDPVLPGGAFDYQLSASCSGLTEGCITAKTVDVLPPDIEFVSASTSSLYTVDYNSGTRTVTVTYKDSLKSPPNPPNSLGIPAGSTRTAVLHVRLSPAASEPDGATITNTATTTADNADPATDSAGIQVTVPRTVTPVATKSVTPTSVIAGSGAVTTATLSVRNGSSASAEVTSLAVSDTAPANWNTFDLASVGPLMELPLGADQVSVQYCTAPAPCGDGSFVAGPFVGGPDLSLPSGVDPGTVTGIRFVFQNSAGTVLPTTATAAGVVPIGLKLRDANRVTGAPIGAGPVQNCAAPSAVDDVAGPMTGTSACATVTVQSGAPKIDTAKQFFPDATGSFGRNGYAVAGQSSGVTAIQSVKNSSTVPVQSLTLTDPSDSQPSDFNKVAVTDIRLVFPAGATSASGSVTCTGGAQVPFTATATGNRPTGCPAGNPPTKVTVTYTGSIPAGATGQLGVHGTLTAQADGTTPISDCFDGQIVAGAATARDTSCATLPVEKPRTTVGGVKNSSSPLTGGRLVPGYPVTFTLQATNNGNLPQTSFVITDPGPSGNPNPWGALRLTGATVTTSPGSLGSRFVIEVTVDGGTTWTPLVASIPAAVNGVRARLTSGQVLPTNVVTLNLSTTLRDSIPVGTTVTNCQQTSVTSTIGDTGSGSACAAALTVESPSTAGQVTKLVTPATLPAPIPGVLPSAQVQLRASNTGNQPMNRIVITDPDPGQVDPDDFFDHVSVTGGLAVNFPPGADRVQVDACLSAAACLAGTYVSGAAAATPAFPAGVDPAAIAGLRFTFTSSGGGYVLTPGANFPNSGTCVNATACFSVTPRTTERAGGAPIAFPASFSNIATAGGETSSTPGVLQSFGQAPAPLTVQTGTEQLTTRKTVDGQDDSSTISPGQPIAYRLSTTNSGTAAVPGLVVTEPLPTGLNFDNTFAGDGGQPFTIAVTVPAGAPAAPAPQFEPVVDLTTKRITALTWTFPESFAFYPTSTVVIGFQGRLDPSVTAGSKITNTYGASSSVPPVQQALTCAGGKDPILGCTDAATAIAGTGSAVDAEKWVHGTDSRGFYNTRTAQFVPIGDAGCPLLVSGSDSYTRFPCIALVFAGENFDFLVTVTNVGTTPLTQTRLIDYLPKVGDRGVVVNGSRGTAWQPRPLMTAPPAIPPGSTGALDLAYAAASPTCTSDIARPTKDCPPGDWDPTFGTDAEAFRAFLTFATPLPPAGSTRIVIPMSSPADLDGQESLPIAWNSFAHTDFFAQPNGSTTQLPPVEPEKVGVAMPFGTLEITTNVTGPIPPLSKIGPFLGTYSCTVTTATGSVVVVASGDAEFSADQPFTVRHVPAGAVCRVVETDTGGGNVTQPGPVTITPDTDPDLPAPTTVVVTNDFPAPRLIVTKAFAGPGASFGAGLGPFTVAVDCRLDGDEITGFPRTLIFPADGTQSVVDDPNGVRLPIGAVCTVAEADTRGATASIAYSPAAPTGVIISATSDVEAIVTNTYDLSQLTVTKTVKGPGTAGPFTFTVACTLTADHLPVTLPADDATFTLTSGQNRVIDVPKGSACVTTEVDPPARDTVSYNGVSSAPTLDLTENQTLAIVDTFTPVPPTTPPPTTPPTTTPPTTTPPTTTPPTTTPPATTPPTTAPPTTPPTTGEPPAPPTPPSELAYTGVDVLGIGGTGLLLLLFGGAVTVWARRRPARG